MIEYKYLSNTQKNTLGYGELDELDKNDILNSILQKYKDAGILIEGENVNLYVIIDDVWFDFDDALLKSNEDIIVLLSDVIPPQSAVNYDYYQSIKYYFHVAEKGHEHNPHIHAEYDNQKISIYLNDYHIDGKMRNPAKQNQAVKYVKRNHKAILNKWNKIMGDQSLH